MIGIYFAKRWKPGRKSSPEFTLGNRQIDIPAGQTDYKLTASFVTPVNVDIVGLTPHARTWSAKDMKATATLPDGSKKQLLWIKDWDF